ncbi:MAG: hypothetical protein ACRDPY_35095 [Streptosporangiaceae bacterium]
MSGHLAAAVRAIGARPFACPVYRSIVVVDLEGSTKRSNMAKGELRRVMYELLDLAFMAAGIGPDHLEELADRGDGVLILIRPHDDVPKTALLGRLIPVLAGLLAEHNAAAMRPELKLRMRAVVHAGEVHDDGRGFYGDDLDVAFRLLNAPAAKRALREATSSPLVLVVSEEIFTAIVRHGYVGTDGYEPAVRVRVGERLCRGWVHIPVPADTGGPAVIRRASGQLPPTKPLTIAAVNGHGRDQQAGNPSVTSISGHGREQPPDHPPATTIDGHIPDQPPDHPPATTIDGHIPDQPPDHPPATTIDGHIPEQPPDHPPATTIDGHVPDRLSGRPPCGQRQRARRAAISAGMTWCRSPTTA